MSANQGKTDLPDPDHLSQRLGEAKNRDAAAEIYAEALRGVPDDELYPWRQLNQAILDRWKGSFAALEYIKRRAHTLAGTP